MFERLLFQVNDSENYLEITLLSFFFTLLSVFLVHRIVPFNVSGQNFAGVIAVLITSLAMAYPFVRHLLIEEQEVVQERWSEKTLLVRHGQDFALYLLFFLGSTLAFAVSTFFVPESFYAVQFNVLESIGAPTGNIANAGFFTTILENNLWVFAVTFVLAFFISSGVLFVLVWNASVLGVHIGGTLSDSIMHVPLFTLPFLPHGIFEIGGYILAGLAGAILSYEAELLVLEEGDVMANSKVLTKDVATLTVIGVACIVIGAGIEASILL